MIPREAAAARKLTLALATFRLVVSGAGSSSEDSSSAFCLGDFFVSVFPRIFLAGGSSESAAPSELASVSDDVTGD